MNSSYFVISIDCIGSKSNSSIEHLNLSKSPYCSYPLSFTFKVSRFYLSGARFII